MVRHHLRSLSEPQQQGGEEPEREPSVEEGQVEGRSLRGCYHYRRRYCSRSRRLCKRRRSSCRRSSRKLRRCSCRKSHRRGCRRVRRRRRCKKYH